jgi:uncharacterized lipoprotein YmbA
MLSGIPRKVALMSLSFLIIAGLVVFVLGNYQTDVESLSLTETLRTTALANRDDSARVSQGDFYLDKENFEKEFEQTIKRQASYQNSKLTITFDYLISANGQGIKAIRVSVFDGRKTDQATCILSTPENEEG